MQINHVALYVDNLEIMREFYIEYFGAIANDRYYNPNTGLQTYFLTFDNGARIEIMNKPNLDNDERRLNVAGYTHVAFSVGSKEQVDELTNKLSDAGYQVISKPRTTGDGYYESCVLDPESNPIEIVE